MAEPQAAVSGGTFEGITTERKQIVVPSMKLEAMTRQDGADALNGVEKKVYHPSETFRLVQKQDRGDDEPTTESGKAIPSRTFARLQQQLE